jgi:carboxyl-terminal processing protease
MKAVKRIFLVIGVIALLFLAYSFGVLIGSGAIKVKPGEVQIVNLEVGKPEKLDFSQFWQIWDLVKTKHVNQVDEKKLYYGAIEGMVAAVGDPYTVYLTPEESKKFFEDMQGNFQGIGAEIGKKKDKLIIVAPLEGSPAEKAGLLPDDVILEINGEPTDKLSVEEAVSKIRGKAGTQVKLTILRGTENKTREFTITRAEISIKSVTWKYLANNSIIQINISRFADDTVQLINEAFNKAKSKGIKKVILDLRNNPGGFLDAGVSVASFFLPKDTVVVLEQDKDGNRKAIKSDQEPKMLDFQVVILINKGSASASEIVAGALSEQKGIKLIGEKSFGKGSVQEVQQFGDGSSLRITVAKWLTPKGKSISDQGLTPDIPIERTQADIENNEDPQLDRAIQELSK